MQEKATYLLIALLLFLPRWFHLEAWNIQDNIGIVIRVREKIFRRNILPIDAISSPVEGLLASRQSNWSMWDSSETNWRRDSYLPQFQRKGDITENRSFMDNHMFQTRNMFQTRELWPDRHSFSSHQTGSSDSWPSALGLGWLRLEAFIPNNWLASITWWWSCWVGW